METKQIAVILLIVAIVLSGVAAYMAFGFNPSDYTPTVQQPVNYVIDTTIHPSPGAVVGVGVVEASR
jgi:hypothetical protein